MIKLILFFNYIWYKSKNNYIYWLQLTRHLGFWTSKEFSDIFKKEFELIAERFSVEIITVRGVHWIDPAGIPEIELSNKYNT